MPKRVLCIEKDFCCHRIPQGSRFPVVASKNCFASFSVRSLRPFADRWLPRLTYAPKGNGFDCGNIAGDKGISRRVSGA